MKRVFYDFLIMVCAVILLTSCQNQKDILYITSYDYRGLEYLEKCDLSQDIGDEFMSLDNPYGSFECNLSVNNGKLFVSNDGHQEANVATFNNGYFVGVDIGEFDGWVEFRPYHNGHEDYGDAVKVTHEQCRKIIRLDNENGYLLTSDVYYENKSTVRCLNYDGIAWTWNVLTEFTGYIYDGFFDERDETLYVFTDQGVFSIDNSGKKTLIFENDFFGKWYWNSIVVLDGKIYCSISMGILCYDMVTNEQLFYKIDYSKII